ncbi:MAG: hypothetical protein ACREEB_05005 [Caulobacteraceae bacterium]
MHEESLDPLAYQLGRLCHVWAEVEFTISRLFETVGGMRAQGAPMMLDCLDPRDKTMAVKAGAIPYATARGAAWAAELIDSLNYVDNTLRPIRNRYVHDLWREHDKLAVRFTFRPKIEKPQAFRRLVVYAGHSQVETEERMMAVLDALKAEGNWIIDLDEIGRSRRWSQLTALLPTRPERPLFLPPVETPGQKGKRTPTP